MGGVTRTLTCVGLVTTGALLFTNLTPDGTPTSLLAPAQVFFASASATHADRAALLSAADAALSPGAAGHHHACWPVPATEVLVESRSHMGHLTYPGLARSAKPPATACVDAASSRATPQSSAPQYAGVRLRHHIRPRITTDRL